jgi:hypothetical protein
MAQDDLTENWNEELQEEVAAEDVGSLVVYSRDWTVETILSQIEKENIDLNPSFQRRNAWNDLKRSKLIESLIIGVPVPEIVLAEDSDKKKSFIVIDGKQRLLAIAGYAYPEKYPSWNNARLRGLGTRSDLNGTRYKDMIEGGEETADRRQLLNSDIRCTVISNFKSVQVLYDIFYRLNTGSVPLSSQELRQVLNRGDFANYLIAITNELLPIHAVLNLDEPDRRLRDAEILLRYISFSFFGHEYTGNLTPFLDTTMAKINATWTQMESVVVEATRAFNEATTLLLAIMPDKKVGRKFTERGWESRFNRALYEVQVYYVSRIEPELLKERGPAFVTAFESLCIESRDFIDSIETSTKTIDNYYKRYSLFERMVNDIYGLAIDAVPVPLRPEA